MKRAALATGLVAAVLLAPNAWAGPAKTVVTDPAGDVGLNGNVVPGVDQTGVDIVKGTVQRKGADLVFTVTMASMPSQGSLPEAARLLYHFDVDKTAWRMTVKSKDVGKPDAAAQSGTERIGKVDQAGHFRLEQCASEPVAASFTLSQCKPKAYLAGKVDPATKSISWTVPLKVIGAKAGQKLKPGTSGAASTGCEICWLPHYGERSLTPHTIFDSASATTWTIPKS